ncbi:MAG TPA: universal stress protein [Gemmatimonadaceae bacterium]|nr:universal stress protein [Gemmatimonadaceae bacterium]
MPETDHVVPEPKVDALPNRESPPTVPAPAEPIGAAEFLTLVRQRKRGRLKVYIGSAAGVGKSYRMLQEAHDLRRRDVDVVVGFVEAHGRADTAALVDDLEVVPRRKIEYRGVVLEEMDVDGVAARHPDVAIVDELAHTNVPGSKHRKRWEDVLELLDAGINVITAVNVQHLESLNDVVQRTLGVLVRETVPDWVVARADQVVNIDLSAEDLRQRLVEGKIYGRERIPAALENFFTEENLTTLRELALREVASSVDRVREDLVRREEGGGGGAGAAKTADRIMVAMSSNPPRTAALLRKASRIAGRLNSDWYCVYVQTPDERADRIDASVQRRLVDNIQMAQAMGAEVVKLEGDDVVGAISRFARERRVSLLIVGKSSRSWWHRVRHGSLVDKLVDAADGLDVLVVSFEEPPNGGRRDGCDEDARLTQTGRVDA